MKKIFLLLLGLSLFSFALTTLYLSMRAIMAIGGSCAEGGPYMIATHCPGGSGWLAPISIFLMFGGSALSLFYSAAITNSPKWGYFFWSALFLSLGWNFFEFSFNPPQGGIDVAWLICGVMFVIMGGGPLFLITKDTEQIINAQGHKEQIGTFKQILLGQNKQNPGQSLKFYETQTALLILHIISLFGGIYLGYLAFIIS